MLVEQLCCWSGGMGESIVLVITVMMPGMVRWVRVLCWL